MATTASLEEIFLSALDKDSEAERSEFLDQACRDRPELRKEVERLLVAHHGAEGFLECPPTMVVTASDQITALAAGEVDLGFLSPSTRGDSLGRLGNYEVLEVVGAGGFGIVLRALDEKLHRIVAIKTLNPLLAASLTARKRFVREARAAAAISHENVVHIYAVEDAGRTPYLAMEYVAGLSLEEKLRQSGPLELKEILRIGLQIAEGLEAAHKHGVVHRDVKPGNILLENSIQRVKITDFGLARAVDDATLTKSGEITGTPAFMSPEQARGEGVDRRSDLFSLGSVLYAMCVGEAPFRATSSLSVLKRVCEDVPRSPRELNPDVPQWLCQIIARLHAKDPAERYQSAAEVANVLGQQLAQLQHPAGTDFRFQIADCGLEGKSLGKSEIRNQGTRGSGSSAIFPPWAIAAAILLGIAVAVGVSESTGTTQLAATVVRIFMPEGTLVVESSDPGVKVTVEGDGGLTIIGAGLEEIRLRPGSYKVHANRDGKPVRLERELVNIAKGGREVVRVKLEAGPAPPIAGSQSGAFVLLGGKGFEVEEFDTLADAVKRASDGDTIEIRGNGPFACDGMTIGQSLVIRAGAGYSPAITLSPAAADKNIALLTTSAPLVLEGLELRRVGGAKGQFEGRYPLLLSAWGGGALHVVNCRFVFDTLASASGGLIASGSPVCTLRNCHFSTDAPSAVAWYFPPGGRGTIENCVSGCGYLMALNLRGQKATDAIVQIRHNTTIGRCLALGFDEARRPAADPLIRLGFSENVTYCAPSVGGSTILRVDQVGLEPPLSAHDAEVLLGGLVTLHEQRNVYTVGTRMLGHAIWDKTGLTTPEASRGNDLADWNQFWQQFDTGSLEGNVRFQGGDLLGRALTKLDILTPDDFRLRADSAGYRAGPDGKDLGADVDLVGPGAAYERWKKTPEYQEWLKETGQLKDSRAAKADTGAFVLLGGPGVAERKFDTLAEAVQAASEGDTIEVRGNGPFISQPLNISRTALTIRAGEGFRPVIKLSPEVIKPDATLLTTNAALVLEGLELQRPPTGSAGSNGVEMRRATLRAANCRFRSGVYLQGASACAFRNCELVSEQSVYGAVHRPGARVSFDNCLLWSNWGTIGLLYESPVPQDVAIQINRSTVVSRSPVVWLPLNSSLPAANNPPAPAPFQVETSDSVFDGPNVLSFTDRSAALDTDKAEATLLRMLQWHAQRNVYAAGSTSVAWGVGKLPGPSHGPESLEQWKAFWGAAETDSLEGRIRFQGGNVASRSGADLDQLTPDDFRMRPDSAGYRAGPDGKDLGADVDLVGPGAAYERWKKTPEYQEWLKETKQDRGQ